MTARIPTWLAVLIVAVLSPLAGIGMYAVALAVLP
jgi:hypothetical protein